MTWVHWIVFTLLIIAALGTISQIDKPRPPVTRGQALFTVILNTALIAGLLVVR